MSISVSKREVYHAEFRSREPKEKPTMFELWSNTQLRAAIDTLLDRVERDEALRVELAAQLENIYNTLADHCFRDYFGALDAAIDNHVALTDSMQSRAELLDALMAEYGKRMVVAMAASRTFVGPCYQRPASSGFIT
jgi:hypothetical protein